MSGLKILNSPSSRIITSCDHCGHVMKTTADSLYYLVECPECNKDFICNIYRPKMPVIKKKDVEIPNSKLYLSFKYSWALFKLISIVLLIINTIYIGLYNDFIITLLTLPFVILTFIFHYFVSSIFLIVKRQDEIIKILESLK